jgi:phytoene dehydrogenase-like protein
MNTYDLAVVGSGIGGSLISGLNKHQNTILFEKDKNLGGCASTFHKFGNYYNIGATTLVGYEHGHIVKKHFDEIGFIPNIQKSSIAIRVFQNNTLIDRTTNFEEFLAQIENIYPNKNNRIFWEKIKQIDDKFWILKNIYYAKYSLNKYFKTVTFIGELFKTYGFDIFKSASSFIGDTLGDISLEYQSFIDSQLFITIQADSKNISLLSLSLGLSYPFHDVFYVNGGMGNLIEDIVKDVEIKKNEEITKIIREKNYWILESLHSSYKTNKLVLNASIYQCSNLFIDKQIQSYYDSFSFSDQSAFTVYLNIDIKKEYLEHYQIILDTTLPNCISKSFFISFSKSNDEKFGNKTYSITISTHTKASFWKNLHEDEYALQKENTQNFIIENFLNKFLSIKKEDIKKYFSATAFTFNRYINRYNCGGKAINMNNITQVPSCNTPFKGLYNVGDTIFAGQGWPGVSIGVDILNKELNESS